MLDSFVSLIIPAYNEERTIGEVIEATAEIMDLYGLPYEIIVINDGSTDKTELVASSTRKALVFTNYRNRGKGYSLRKGLTYSRGDIIVTLDSDGQHKPKEIPDILNLLSHGYDIVSGSRFLSNRPDVTTQTNLVGNFLFNTAIMVLTGRKVTDSQTGFRAMKRDFAKKLNLQSDGFEIESEITVKSLMNGFYFKEIPITVEMRKYHVSRLKKFSDGRRILSRIIRSVFFQPDHRQDPASKT